MPVNARNVSAGGALDVLQAGWAAQSVGQLTTSWMLHGRPGVGKTEVVQQLADSIGAELFDLRLTSIEPQDLRGLPFYDHENQRTVWFPPEDLPGSDAPAVLFLDELTAASPLLQPSVYGLLQERRVGRHRLPDSVFIVAAGNTVDDGAVAYDMGTALSDRLVHMVVRADPEDWLRSYAPKAGLHPTVAAFIRIRPDLLDTTELSMRRGDMITCTPRSWSRVGHIMSIDCDRITRDVMISGTVGEAAAAEFALISDEIHAGVAVDALLSAPRGDRNDMFPNHLHGLTALIYALPSAVNEDTVSAAIEILADLRGLTGTGLPVSELATFGFEILIAKAIEQGWQAAFAVSPDYAEYAKSRQDAGLP